MNWLKTYREKLTTAEGAVRLINSGERVYVHPGCAKPEILVEALMRRAPELRDVELMHMLALGGPDYADPAWQGHFRHNALFIGPNAREAVRQGLADYTPILLHEIEALFLSGQIPLDAVLLQLSPPDEHGYMSLGVSVDCTLTAARCARHVIAEVNQQVPRALGDAFLHVSKVSAVVETSHPLLEMKPVPFTELQHRIARNVASVIPDGATLQTGVGGIPDAVLSCLFDHKDLGIHSEMIADGAIALIEAGIINGERKTLHPGRAVAGFVLGTEKLFRFIHDNPIFEFHPTMYVNDPFIIAQNDNMIAINSALQVDITGQVCADSLGTKPYSGFGGQLDFVRGAARSRGGKPIIALPSTARDGAVSRIVPVLDPGAGVVTSRADVHYVITEHGVAYLHGKTQRQRVEALIAVADPRFREELYEFAYQQHYLQPRCVTVP